MVVVEDGISGGGPGITIDLERDGVTLVKITDDDRKS